MPNSLTRKLRMLLLAPCLVLPLGASTCSGPIQSTPDPARFEPAALPVPPTGEAHCDDNGDGVLEPCLSDSQTGHLIDALIDTIEADAAKLKWLGDYYLKR